MVTVIGVRFKTAGKVYYFDPGNYELNGHNVMALSDRALASVRLQDIGFVFHL